MIEFTYLRGKEAHNFLLVDYPELFRIRLFRRAPGDKKVFNGELVVFNFEYYKIYVFTSSGGKPDDINNKIGKFLQM